MIARAARRLCPSNDRTPLANSPDWLKAAPMQENLLASWRQSGQKQDPCPSLLNHNAKYKRLLPPYCDFANGVRSYADALWSAVQKVALWGFEQGLSFGQSFWTGPQAPSAQQSPQRTGPYEVGQFTSKKILAGPSPPAPARIAPARDGGVPQEAVTGGGNGRR